MGRKVLKIKHILHTNLTAFTVDSLIVITTFVVSVVKIVKKNITVMKKSIYGLLSKNN